MLQHFRFILPLLPKDENGLTSLHYYDSAIQLARTSRRQLGEEAFLIGMRAANEIKRMCVPSPFSLLSFSYLSPYPLSPPLLAFGRLNECRIEMLEGSNDRLAMLAANT